MTKETISLCGKKVEMLYCAAAETGYEDLSGKSVEVFIPKQAVGNDGSPIYDDNGKAVYNQPTAMLGDYIKLGIAAIAAAYDREDSQSPIDAKDIIYDANPQDITTLVTTVSRLRNSWYTMPASVTTEDANGQKN